jgi:hypothetical protein
MIRFVQHFSLLCCFILLFLLQDDHLKARPADLQAPNSVALQNPGSTAAPGQPISDIIDIYGPLDLAEQPPYLLYAALVSAVLLGTGAVYFIYRRLRRTKATPADYAAIARHQIDRAEAQRQHLTPPIYCQKISDILRIYLEQRTGRRVTRRTSSEALEDLGRNSGLNGSEIEMLRRCFSICDMVKFGRFSPPHEETERLGRLALALVSEKDRDNNAGGTS